MVGYSSKYLQTMAIRLYSHYMPLYSLYSRVAIKTSSHSIFYRCLQLRGSDRRCIGEAASGGDGRDAESGGRPYVVHPCGKSQGKWRF